MAIALQNRLVRGTGVMEEYLVCSRQLAGEMAHTREPEDLAALPFVANAVSAPLSK